MWIMRHNLAKVLSFTSATEEAALLAPFKFFAERCNTPIFTRQNIFGCGAYR